MPVGYEIYPVRIRDNSIASERCLLPKLTEMREKDDDLRSIGTSSVNRTLYSSIELCPVVFLTAGEIGSTIFVGEVRRLDSGVGERCYHTDEPDFHTADIAQHIWRKEQLTSGGIVQIAANVRKTRKSSKLHQTISSKRQVCVSRACDGITACVHQLQGNQPVAHAAERTYAKSIPAIHKADVVGTVSAAQLICNAADSGKPEMRGAGFDRTVHVVGAYEGDGILHMGEDSSQTLEKHRMHLKAARKAPYAPR